MAGPAAINTDLPAGALLERGQAVSRFVVLGMVGSGAMGEVYAAYDPELDRKVAIKVLRAPRGPDNQKARFLREAQAIAKLQHPNVVVVFDVGTVGDNVFIAMEHVEGHTVADWLKAAPRTRRDIVEVYLAAGRGLAAAHAAGLIHRDFKPDNVMVTTDGQVRVMDFGLARALDDSSGGERPSAKLPLLLPPGEMLNTLALEPDPAVAVAPPDGAASRQADLSTSSKYLSVKVTQTGAMLGTPAYMAPEQFARGSTDARTDQFSFCVALYESLFGVRPFAGDTFVALMTNVTTGALSPPSEKTGVPTWLRKVLLRGLATDPAARYPSMTALLAALQADPTLRRRRVLALSGAFVLAAILLIIARRQLAEEPRPLCNGGTARLAGTWGPPGVASPRRTTIDRAFRATNSPFAGQAFATVARYLDQYVAAWLGAYRDACEMTHVRGEQSTEVLDLRMACLNDRLGELHAVTEELATANDKVVQNAVSGVSALNSISDCSDVRLLRTVMRPPADQSTKDRVEALRALKARLFASTLSARCKTTRKIEEEVLAGARGVKYPPLLAETLLACGKVEDTCGSRGDALARLYQEAFTVALSSGHDQVAAESAIFLASTLADRERQVAAARQWHAIGQAIVTRMGRTPALDVVLNQAEGVIAQGEHDEKASLAALERARIGTAKLRGAEHPYVALILNAEGVTLHGAGKNDRALTVLRKAEEILWKVVGADHPWVATVLANEGDVLNALHRYGEARAAFEMATTIWTKENAEPSRMAAAQTGLGIALVGAGRPSEAVAPLERALAARADSTTPPALRGETRWALARAAWATPSGRGRAVTLARAARVDYSDAGDASRTLQEIDGWLRAVGAGKKPI